MIAVGSRRAESSFHGRNMSRTPLDRAEGITPPLACSVPSHPEPFDFPGAMESSEPSGDGGSGPPCRACFLRGGGARVARSSHEVGGPRSPASLRVRCSSGRGRRLQ